jgi:hypothetical protein
MAGLAWRWFLPRCLVRTMAVIAVIVAGVLGRDAAEMPSAGNQHVIYALAAQRPREPFRVGCSSSEGTSGLGLCLISG